jgi:hypothetical protein
MKCPYCNNEFPLTWKRYLLEPFGTHTCPTCVRKSKLTWTLRYAFLLSGAGLLAGGLALVFSYFRINRIIAIPLAIGIAFIAYLPVDRFGDAHLRLLKKPNEK